VKLEEKIKVMQHYANGGVVQIKLADGVWRNFFDKPNWNWEDNEYRIKPKEPREFWVVQFPNGYNAYECKQKGFEGRMIHVREVIEEDTP
jgi:hypothetical protein